MHDIEPYYAWRDLYTAEEDEKSPFFERTYDEFEFHNKIYNYYIHPQWDEFGSLTLYTKLLWADYDEGFAILEFIGEWNDTIYNDIKYLKREVIDLLIKQGIYRFILICENVLNFHGSDDCYYEEWFEEIAEEGGWIACLGTLKHVEDEMIATQLQYYMKIGGLMNNINWRKYKPLDTLQLVETAVYGTRNQLRN